MGLKKENICISLITETEFYPGTTGRVESFCADYIFKNPKITTRLIDWFKHPKLSFWYILQ